MLQPALLSGEPGRLLLSSPMIPAAIPLFLSLLLRVPSSPSVAKNPALRPALPSTGWPALPKSGFVSGRPATNVDVNEGRAVFVMKGDAGPVGQPMKIAVPQYALYIDAEARTRTAGIVIQAEEYRELKLIGFRSIAGKLLGGTLKEFRLLGTLRPAKELLTTSAPLPETTPRHP